ncbi:hypothetical protein PIB30_064906 [Stylosanthes scabra]|uniref:Reverse transcriptase domain-containing protein n=1 Tax=Stylosanthes scabra TaxID=79078 RepID=A0ABU6RM74_9FABA|nr:hypothetical protein [Stylosanthes scabra]
MQYPNDSESCMRVDVIDSIMERAIEEEISSKHEENSLQEELEEEEEEGSAKNSHPTKPEKIVEEKPSKLELKPLPPTLKYAFPDEEETLPVIINSALTDEE